MPFTRLVASITDFIEQVLTDLILAFGFIIFPNKFAKMHNAHQPSGARRHLFGYAIAVHYFVTVE